MNLPEVLAFLQTSQEEDRAMQIAPRELHGIREQNEGGSVHLLDIRTREEFDAVHIHGFRALHAGTHEHDPHAVATRTGPHRVD